MPETPKPRRSRKKTVADVPPVAIPESGSNVAPVEKPKEKQYTAVVYFHGMGAQRRYEEISRLVDALDRLSYVRRDTVMAGIPVNKLTRIDARLEPSRVQAEQRLSYIRAYYDRGETQPEGFTTAYRFYEAYWAPLAAGKSSARSVIKWLFSQFKTPLLALFSSWRDRDRLRRAALYALWQRDRHATKPAFSDAEYQDLLNQYDAFEEPDKRRDFEKGTFRTFLTWLKTAGNGEKAERRIGLALRWRRGYVLSELYNMMVLLTILLAIVILITAVIGSLLRTIATLGEGLAILRVDFLKPYLSVSPLKYLIDLVPYAPPPFLALAMLLVAGFGMRRFLRDYLGDVQLWTTYEETDDKHKTRSDILERGVVLLRHVLSDPACGRIVVIGHSLGSAIAYDCLLELGRINRSINAEDPFAAELRLDCIDHFVTLASPIDKIHYFFESHTGKYHRYNRVVDDIRGDIGVVPFAKNRKPNIHWVNYWDKADVISAAIESASSRHAPLLMVDNIQVSNYLLGLPGPSHSGYFKHERVMADLFSMIFHGSHSYKNPPRDAQGRPDHSGILLGPGIRHSFFEIAGIGLALIPWLIFFASLLVAWTPLIAMITLNAALALIAAGAIVAGVSAAMGHRKSIE
jgi:pimeloyl-ACP methyl ester carboxylesterase